jgi:dihydrofolate reductase
MYEVMAAWETMDQQPGAPAYILDFAKLWQEVDKVVYSTSLSQTETRRTRMERAFEPEQVHQLKLQAKEDISIGGPLLAGQAIRAGLVDELQLFIAPVLVGSGKRALPDDVRIDMELLDERRFSSGFVFVRYRLLST